MGIMEFDPIMQNNDKFWVVRNSKRG
jgi:hypothetical protein